MGGLAQARAEAKIVPVFWGMSGWKSAIRMARASDVRVRCMEEFTPVRGFSALHDWEPIAGLRSYGKGANRTILDCLFRRIGRRKSGFSAAAGVAGAAASSGRALRVSGAVPPAADKKGLEIVTTASSAEPTRRDFLFVATGAVAAVGAAAIVWPLVSQMNPDASTIAAGAPIEVDLTPIAEGQDIKVFWRGKPIYIGHHTRSRSTRPARSRSRTACPIRRPTRPASRRATISGSS